MARYGRRSRRSFARTSRRSRSRNRRLNSYRVARGGIRL